MSFTDASLNVISRQVYGKTGDISVIQHLVLGEEIELYILPTGQGMKEEKCAMPPAAQKSSSATSQRILVLL